jgi:regulator of RNase E activity RraA
MGNGIYINHRVEKFEQGIKEFMGLPSSVVSDVMGRLVGTTGLLPINRSTVSVCGNAFTVRVRGGDNLLIHKALDMLKPGDVLIVDGEGDISRALVGEIMMNYAAIQGAIGFVIDGAVRDIDAFEERNFPCWAKGVSLRGPYKDGPGSINIPVTIGGMLVQPGDIILGDSDGVVAIPQIDALGIAQSAKEKILTEKKMIADINSGTYSSSWVEELLKQKGGLS